MSFESRFDGWSRTASALVLAALLLVAGLTGAMAIKPIDVTGGMQATAADGEDMSDVKLYRSIIEDVRAGENYYRSAARHHREYGYALQPFVTVRLPAVALLSAYLGWAAMLGAALALVAAVSWVWNQRLKDLEPKRAAQYWPVMIGASALLVCSPVLLTFHESWAGLLIALSLGLRRPGVFGASVAVGLAAAVVRDLAVAYLLLMAAAALIERRWLETCAWSGAIAVMAVVLALHAQAVGAVVLPGDLVSQGWNGQLGWPFYLAAVVKTSFLIIFPERLAHALVPLCLFGWLSWRSDLALRTLGLLAGYAAMLMLFARQENAYWSVLTTPLLFAGLVPAVLAIRQLIVQADPEVATRLRAALDRALPRRGMAP